MNVPLAAKTHSIETIKGSASRKYRCTCCFSEWTVYPKSSCPGIRAYSSRDPKVCPPNYQTLSELATKGLKPVHEDQPVAVYWPQHHGNWQYLYDKRKTVFKEPEEAIIASLKQGGKALLWFVNLIAGGVLSILIGLNTPASSFTSIPVVAFILNNPLLSLIITGFAVLLTLIASLIFFKLTSSDNQYLFNIPVHPWSLVTGTSTVSFLLCFALLVVVLAKPPWCPSSLCTQVTNPQGVHDANLDAYFLTFESNTFTIPGNPANTYSQDISNETNPNTTGVVDMKNGKYSSDYRIVIVVHSLYQGRYSILLDQVNLVVEKQRLIPDPLNVWLKQANVTYEASRYVVTYRGQGNTSILPAKYIYTPGGYTQLLSMESDQLDIQVGSIVPVYLQYKIQVTYHIATDIEKHTLTLPQTFNVIFSGSSNWHMYQLHAGHFVASS